MIARTVKPVKPLFMTSHTGRRDARATYGRIAKAICKGAKAFYTGSTTTNERSDKPMNKYMFRTTTTMKPYNNKQWFICSDIIRTKYINAKNLREALKAYAAEVADNDYITITPNAIKNRQPMFRDMPNGTPQQVGYVITGKTEFQRDNGTWSTQYIDLWIDICIVTPAEFEEAI